MKIKTITYHEVYNYGASLQEYALLQFLNEQGWQASDLKLINLDEINMLNKVYKLILTAKIIIKKWTQN